MKPALGGIPKTVAVDIGHRCLSQLTSIILKKQLNLGLAPRGVFRGVFWYDLDLFSTMRTGFNINLEDAVLDCKLTLQFSCSSEDGLFKMPTQSSVYWSS